MQYLFTYLMIINALGFLLMLLDKQKARCGAWRIPEATLLGVALIGGSVGSLLGMYAFRHKTRHPQFTVGIPAIIIGQIILAIIIL